MGLRRGRVGTRSRMRGFGAGKRRGAGRGLGGCRFAG